MSEQKMRSDRQIGHRLRLRDLFVFAYEDETGIWYDWNPLLGELRRGGA